MTHATETMDTTFFIAKFEAIPDELWITEKYSDKDEDGEKTACALGHCAEYSATSFALIKVFEPDFRFRNQSESRIANINDGLDPDYPQPTPKARVLAALRDAQAKGL